MNRRPKPDAKTKQVLMMMRIFAWVAIVYIICDIGVLLISFVVSCESGAAAGELYGGMDEQTLKQISLGHYLAYLSFKIALSVMKAYVLFLLTKVLSTVSLVNPFNMNVARLLEKISHTLMGIVAIAIPQNFHIEWVTRGKGIEFGTPNIWEFIFMAGLVFIISKIFKRAVEMQSEIDLTV